MSKIFLDLTELFDRRIPLKSPILEQGKNLRWGRTEGKNSFKPVKRGEAEFVFSGNKQKIDHLECDSQILEVGGRPTRSVLIAGGCRWGYFKEDFRLEFADGRAEIFTVCLSDMGFPLDEILKGLSGTDKMVYAGKCRAFDIFNSGGEKQFMFYCKKDLEKPGVLDRICFPDNCFMKIFAITLED